MFSSRLPLLLVLPLAACPGGGNDTEATSTGSSSADTTSGDPTTGATTTTITTSDEPTTATPTSTPPTTGDTDTATATTSGTSDTTADTTAGDDTDTGPQPLVPTVLMPRSGITVDELMVLANDQDPQSMAVAVYYQEKRQIPPENILTLSFAPSDTLSPDAFNGLKAQIDAAAGTKIQAFAVAWTNPHKVDCQSLVTALALGVDKKFCSTQGNPCGGSAASGYYDSPSHAPFTDLGIRPAMHLAGVTAEDVFKVIDRGVASDSTYPTGKGYFVRTTDEARSVRWPQMQGEPMAWAQEHGITIEYIDNSMNLGSNVIENKTDVLFYLTGLADVPQIATNTYLPGAIADHLTSTGGQIPQSGQMSIVRWLEAGATASYGTAFEPCNYTTKFPNTQALLPHYYRGETVIEAYWKSVDWPGEGVFVGEPLARPWGGAIVNFEAPMLTIETYQLVPNKLYNLESGDSADGPWALVTADITIPVHTRAKITVPDATAAFYRVVEKL